MSKPGIFLGYRLEPGGQWKGDYYVADLEHFRNGFSRASVHQVKGYVFPMLAAYERLTREVQLLDTGEGKGLPKADSPAEPDNQLGADDTNPDASADVPKRDHWVRDEESKSWHRHHVDARQAFFGDDSSPLPPGGPSQADVDDYRVTHLKYLDSTQQCIRDDRRVLYPGHRIRTHRFWTGVTILYEKGHAPSRAPRVTLTKFKTRLDKVKDLGAGEPKAHTLHGDELNYDQKVERKERSYSGSGKPNSISSTHWRGMSVNMRRIYIEAEREEALKRARAGEAAPSNPAGPALVKRGVLIEFACEPDSKLSATMLEQGGDATRVHKELFDILKNKDMTRLIEIVDQNPGCDFWGSIPCGPWST